MHTIKVYLLVGQGRSQALKRSIVKRISYIFCEVHLVKGRKCNQGSCQKKQKIDKGRHSPNPTTD